MKYRRLINMIQQTTRLIQQNIIQDTADYQAGYNKLPTRIQQTTRQDTAALQTGYSSLPYKIEQTTRQDTAQYQTGYSKLPYSYIGHHQTIVCLILIIHHLMGQLSVAGGTIRLCCGCLGGKWGRELG